jgi:biopolymer transport protein ExbD
MPIHHPGEKHRHSYILSKKKGKRSVTAVLSLTAMVDMFTVLVIFLLQNYNATGEVLYIPKEVVLPSATSTKELKPSTVVTISSIELLVDKDRVTTFEAVKAEKDWMIQPLYQRLIKDFQTAKEKAENGIQPKLRKVVDENGKSTNSWNKVTIQSDKGVDFLMLKKVMYTATEAGASEINFAVSKETESPADK